MKKPNGKKKRAGRAARVKRGRTAGSYDALRFDEEDLLELDEEEEFLREGADLIEDEDEEDDEETEEPIEDLAESLDADTWDRSGSDESLTDEPEQAAEADESAEEEDLLTDEEVRDFTQEFEKIPEDIADLEAGEPAPKEYDAYEEDEDDGAPAGSGNGGEAFDEEDGTEYFDEDEDDEEDEESGQEGRTAAAIRKTRRRSAWRRGVRKSRRKKGGKKEGGEKRAPIRLTTLEWLAVVMCVLLVLTAISLGSMYARMQKRSAQAAAFQEIGVDLADLRIIGESGLIAMRDAAALRVAQASLEEPDEEEEEETAEPEEAASVIEVTMTLTTIKSDLKVKFVNAETGKLVASVPFAVTAKAPSGKSETWTDTDSDGVIYRTGIEAGTWSITPEALDAAYADRYTLSTKPKTASVKDTIEYKKVDVSDEIKKESQVNVAVEDTEPKEATAVESVNTDTVEWVESSREEIDAGDGTYSWQEVQKADIAAPSTTARLDFSRMIRFSAPAADSTDAGTGGGQENTDGENQSTGANEGGENGGGAGGSASTEASSEASTAAPAEASTATADPTAEASTGASAGASDTGSTASDSASTAANSASTASNSASTAGTAASATRTLTLSPTTLSLLTGSSGTITPTSGGFTSPTVSFASSDTSVATVSESGAVKGLKAGKATITVTAKEGDASATATCEVTVSDGGTLKTKSGETVYVKSGDAYREATAADYATASAFYLKTSSKKYIYHGWQTIDGYTYYYDKNGSYVTGDQTILGVQYHFSSEGVLSSGSGALGIDVSKWNGKIDWNAVKNSGVSYAIIRCGYRGTSTGVLVEDSNFRSNMQGALNAGLKVGAYFFSAAVNDVEAVEEASMAASLCSGYRLAYPIFLDVERSSSGGGRADNISSANRTAVIRAFCATVANSGYKAGLYANKNWMESMIDTPSLTGYKLWLAQYAAAPTYSRTRYDMWQYTSQGSIGGISGKVDLNVSYLGY